MTRAEACALARQEQSHVRAIRLDALAELISNGATLRAAAKDMGIGESTALRYWSEIKTGLGAQAA